MKIKFKNTKGTEYTVNFKKPDGRRFKDKTGRGRECLGVCWSPRMDGTADIEIDPNRTDQTIFNTVIHEVTHAYFEDATETEVTKFANTLSRILFNNLQFKNYNLQQLIK
jgi:hypothetical protein